MKTQQPGNPPFSFACLCASVIFSTKNSQQQQKSTIHTLPSTEQNPEQNNRHNQTRRSCQLSSPLSSKILITIITQTPLTEEKTQSQNQTTHVFHTYTLWKHKNTK